ncbi:hypothetical protein BDN72DRAFT_907692 [Pluteus cervinus]|uniref:Uncharacterized protein n=1 Tax=Pluteus cervinus TaxID=181527 RepID=A0ACD3BG29_9AGAR|nr:hypothetical protein BDN72DRAFT_907692 [Pluteus cervinus]
MSALAAALAAFATAPDGPTSPESSPSPPPQLPIAAPQPQLPPAPASPMPLCHSPVPSLSATISSSSSLSSDELSVLRPNEHLAVLLPKTLWKPDALSAACDNFYCRIRFNIFERRHHCRKCGGVFCASCTTRTTALLDTSNLDFIHPPHKTLISVYDSPTSPVLPSRVCDDCWDQVHGTPTTPRTPDLVRPALIRALSTPIAMLKRPLSSTTSSGESSLSSSVSTPPNDINLAVPITRKPRSLRNAPSLSSLNSRSSRRVALRASHLPLPEPEFERSYGELDAYPLRRSSVLCKATGGGRWEPKQSPIMAGYRVPVPGGKAPFEIEMEQEEREEKARHADVYVRDGDFQYRLIRKPEVSTLSNNSL